MTDEAGNPVAWAVRTYKPNDDYAWARYADARDRLGVDPEAGVAAARPYVSSEVASERGAAAMIIGELVSLRLPSAAEACSELLFQQLLIETDRHAIDDLAVGIGKMWNTYDDTEGTILALAGHPNPNIRYAVAQDLAFSTTDRPEDAAARAMLETLKDDPDPEVRSWAAVGLETLSIG